MKPPPFPRLLLASSIVHLAQAVYDGPDLPQVSAAVSYALSQYGEYTAFAGVPESTAAASTVAVPTAAPAPIAREVALDARANACAFWLEDIPHRGRAAFNNNTGYQVFRNVKTFGAKGDGVTDDTAGWCRAGNRFSPESHTTSTNTPAIVYFPPGTYLISTSIIDYYYTQIIGNPNCLPTLKATANFSGFGLIDGNQYTATGIGWNPTNLFYRTVRNLIFDMLAVPASLAVTGIHWPTSQATSLQNLKFLMSSDAGTRAQGVFIEQGSGGFMTDLVFEGGLYGLNQGNQQFTQRNLTFRNCVTAISQIWNWGFTYSGISVSNCSVGIDMSSPGSPTQLVGAITVIDSTFTDTPVGILSRRNATATPEAYGALVLENVQFNRVATAVKRTDGTTALAGSTGLVDIKAWAQGHIYNPTGPKDLMGKAIAKNKRPGSLVVNGKYLTKSKPQYNSIPASQFLSVRAAGAVGDGVTDDTAKVQAAINLAASSGRICYFDTGNYKINTTVYVPAGSRIVGEAYSVILSYGVNFANAAKPLPVVQVGKPNEVGVVEWSDMIVSTQGQQGGAILIQWNLASTKQAPSGLWDVHTRVGGFIGSQLESDRCPTTPGVKITSANYARQCVGAFLLMHITKTAAALYIENSWQWTADHSLDAFNDTQLTVYVGRGMLVEGTAGPLWLYGTSVEHNALYQYQFVNASNIFAGQIQTETPYYQPNPDSTVPFPSLAAWSDPVYSTVPYTTGTNGVAIPNCNAYALRAVNTRNLRVYGAGFYSFFSNYSTACSQRGSGPYSIAECQSRLVSLEGNVTGTSISDLHTIGARIMLARDGADTVLWNANQGDFTQQVAMYRA